jgi:glycosyltransferase involved in cell wall biosynthesis
VISSPFLNRQGEYFVFSRPLRICLLSYRSSPNSGGQGVYVRHLSKALADLGHTVEVISGPPGLSADPRVCVQKLYGLDLYNPQNLFRIPSLKELADPINMAEWIGVATAGFPEPFTFGLRAYLYLKNRTHAYDVVHDNQSLSYGVWGISRRIPTAATIHHPITVDRRLAMASAGGFHKKLKEFRWFSFLRMQRRIAGTLSHIITVSESAKKRISQDFGVPAHRFAVIPNGIDTEAFYPMPSVSREKGRIIATASADIPLKGLRYLLQAVSEIAKTRSVRLIVVGTPKKDSGIESLITDLNIRSVVRFTGPISQKDYVREYARASMAVVPSLYEGFGLPAGEAMACETPVVSTTGGALPEVVGNAGILTPPADAGSLARAIMFLMDHPDRAAEIGKAGYQRVHQLFTWKQAAEKTVKVYHEAISTVRR